MSVYIAIFRSVNLFLNSSIWLLLPSRTSDCNPMQELWLLSTADSRQLYVYNNYAMYSACFICSKSQQAEGKI